MSTPRTLRTPRPPRSPIFLLPLLTLAYLLHQDVWFWRSAHPLVFGFLPIGLFYHAVFTAGCSLLLWILVRAAWPAHLDSTDPSDAAE